MKNNIEELIPHRHPFLFVDAIISATKDGVTGVKTFGVQDNPLLSGSFPEYGIVPGMILIESMAQCGGAGIKQRGLADGVFGLASLNNVLFLAGVNYGEQVTYIIKNIRISKSLIKQSGVAYCRNKSVVEATWLSVKIRD